MSKNAKARRSELTKKVLRTLRNWQVIGVAVATTFVFVGGDNSTF